MVVWWKSFAFRFVALYTLVAVVATLGALTVLYDRAKGEVTGKFGLALESIAGTTAPFIPGDALDAINETNTATSARFIEIRDILARVAEANRLEEDQIYILRPDADGAYHFAVMLHARTFIGDLYHPPPMVAERYAWVHQHRDTVRTRLYTDAHGSFISGIAPVLRKDGTVAGLLQVDYGVDAYLEAIREERKHYLVGLAILVAVFIAFGAWMNRRLRQDVQALIGGTRAIETERYDHRVVVGGGDEMAVVAEALNRALAGLKERFEMLRFLPRHTAKMIEDATKTGNVQRSYARRAEVAVFESDIRGFTKISESLPAEAIVSMLNEYIRVQAEIIGAAQGSIDKYMGDAVLAIFEGEHKARRAVEAAIAIQAAVEAMNEAKAFDVPVHVGIGITVGELVIGNMGSDARMEHTVIGSPVNLAARLCSQAAGGEIAVAESVRVSLGGHEDGLAFSSAEDVTVKGFDQPVRCYRASAAGGASDGDDQPKATRNRLPEA